LVPAEDHAIEILRQNSVIRRFDNGSIMVGREVVGALRRARSTRHPRRRPVTERLIYVFQGRVPGGRTRSQPTGPFAASKPDLDLADTRCSPR
jgi:hypothetical protein